MRNGFPVCVERSHHGAMERAILTEKNMAGLDAMGNPTEHKNENVVKKRVVLTKKEELEIERDVEIINELLAASSSTTRYLYEPKSSRAEVLDLSL